MKLFTLAEPLDERARRTFAGDCLRQFLGGFIDTGPKTFFLLIAVQRFSAGDLAKTLISVPGSAAMVLSVFLVPFLGRFRVLKSRWLAVGRALAGVCYLMAAAHPSLAAYAFWIFIGGFPATVVYPMLTSLYHDNYPRRARGRLFAWGSMINMAAGAAFSWLIGLALGAQSERYREVLLLFGAVALLSALVTLRLPSTPHVAEKGRTFIHAFHTAWKDRLFAYMLGVWFLFGFAAFLTLPLRVLYLTEPRYGLEYSAATVALLLGVVPEALRMVSTPLWAWLFDHRNFVMLRAALNWILLASLAAFFLGKTLPWLWVSAVLDGIFSGGATLAWSLWVTQVAPKGRTAEYMSVSLFFNGVRGVVGTWLGIRLASLYGLEAVAWAGIGLIVASNLLMRRVRGNPQWMKGDPAAGTGGPDASR